MTKRHFIIFGIFALLSISGCKKESSVSPVELQPFYDREFTGIKLSSESLLNLTNQFGSVHIYGIGIEDTITVYIFKTIKAQSRSEAEKHFNDIQLISSTNGDTIISKIEIQNGDSEIDYACGVFLEIPYKLICDLYNVQGIVSVSDLDTLVTVTNSSDSILVIRHNGSCELNTQKGNLNIEVAIPENGYCRGTTSSGNVLLSIPQSTSSILDAISHDGSVVYSNIEMDVIHQSDDSLSAILGTGNGNIHLETVSGDIQISGF